MHPDPTREPPLDWRCIRLGALTPQELQRIHIARQQVFAVEQQCIFQDADDVDAHALHLGAWTPDGALLAYARIVDAGVKYREPSLGRVLTVASKRGSGLGHELLRRAVAACDAAHAGQPIRISAQLRLAGYYARAGFVRVGEPYLEDGQPHLEMLRPATSVSSSA